MMKGCCALDSAQGEGRVGRSCARRWCRLASRLPSLAFVTGRAKTEGLCCASAVKRRGRNCTRTAVEARARVAASDLPARCRARRRLPALSVAPVICTLVLQTVLPALLMDLSRVVVLFSDNPSCGFPSGAGAEKWAFGDQTDTATVLEARVGGSGKKSPVACVPALQLARAPMTRRRCY